MKIHRGRALIIVYAGVALTPMAIVCAAGTADVPRTEQQSTGTPRATSAVLLAVDGNVQIQTGENAPWTKAAPGMIIAKGGALRTSLRSAAQLRIGENQTITIDRLGLLTFEDLVNLDNTDHTRLGLEYGRVVFNVNSTRFANDVKIETADTTLAVKGTEGGIDNTPGFPVLGFGTETNDGVFTMDYGDDSLASIKEDEQSSSDHPDPADQQSTETETDTGDPASRDPEEEGVADRSAGGSDSTQSMAGLGSSEPDSPIVSMDEFGNIIINTGGAGGDDFDTNGTSPPPPPPPPPPSPPPPPPPPPGPPPPPPPPGPPPPPPPPSSPLPPMTLDSFFASGGTLGDDGDLRRRKLFAFDEEEVLSRLPFTGSVTSGAGMMQDDGLGGGYLYKIVTALNIRNPADPNDDIHFETLSERINLFYLFGGVRDSGTGAYLAYNTLYLDYHYREITLANGIVIGRKSQNLGLPRLIEKYTPGPMDLASNVLPAVTGAAFLGFPNNPQTHSIGLYGVQDMGFQSVGTPRGGAFPGQSQIVDLRTDFNSRTLDTVNPIMDFGVPLHGALAASRERGSLFTVADLPATGNDALARAILEYDPRNNYLRNAWSTLGSTLAVRSVQTVTGAAETFHTFGDPGFRAKGASFVQGHLVVAFDRDPTRTAQAAAAGPQYFTFNPDAINTVGDPHIVRVDTGVPASTALAELANESLALAGPQALFAPGGPIDTTSINELFSRLAYSQQSLDSGVVRRVFEHHFQDTAINPAACTTGNSVFDQIPSKLAQFVNTQSGIGRVAHELRNPGGMPLTSDQACAAPNVLAPVP